MLRFVSTSHSSAHLLFLVVVVENFSQLFFFLVSSPKQCPACQEYFSKFSFCICVHTVVYLFCQSGKLFSVTWQSSAITSNNFLDTNIRRKNIDFFNFSILYLPLFFVFFLCTCSCRLCICFRCLCTFFSFVYFFCRLCTFLWFVFSSSWLLGFSQHHFITWPRNNEYWRPKNKVGGCLGKTWENICKNMAFVPALVMGCSFSPDQSSQAKANLLIYCKLLFVDSWNTSCVFVWFHLCTMNCVSWFVYYFTDQSFPAKANLLLRSNLPKG